MSKPRTIGSIKELQEVEQLFKESNKTLLYHDGSKEHTQYYSMCYEVYPALNIVPKNQKVTLNEAMVMLVSRCFRVWFQYDFRKMEGRLLCGTSHYKELCQCLPGLEQMVDKLKVEDIITGTEFKVKEVKI
jgi:hypothetical protein